MTRAWALEFGAPHGPSSGCTRCARDPSTRAYPPASDKSGHPTCRRLLPCLPRPPIREASSRSGAMVSSEEVRRALVVAPSRPSTTWLTGQVPVEYDGGN